MNSKPICDKNPQKTKNREDLPQLDKQQLFKNPTINVKLYGLRLNTSPLRLGTRQGHLPLPLLMNIVEKWKF